MPTIQAIPAMIMETSHCGSNHQGLGGDGAGAGSGVGVGGEVDGVGIVMVNFVVAVLLSSSSACIL